MPFGSSLFTTSDIYQIDGIVKHVGVMAGRSILVDALRHIFGRSKDYHYVSDAFGFPKTPSNLGLDLNAGINDELTTRIFIGSTYRYDISYLPAIVVRPVSLRYRPISFNQNKGEVKYDLQKVVDGYGNTDFIRMPEAFVFVGAWDQVFEVKVTTKSAEDTAQITDIVVASLQGTFRDDITHNGLFIKSVSAGGETAENINANDPLFSMSVSVDTYSEWKREIPISDVVDRIQMCFNFDMSPNDPPATGLAYKQTL